MLLPFQLYDANLSLCTCELCEFDFEPCNANKKVSSLDQFLSYMNKEVIFDSFPGIENVIVSDVLRAVSYLHSRDYTLYIGIENQPTF